MKNLRWLVGVTAGALMVATLALPAVAGATPRITLRNSTESWAKPANVVGAPAADRTITFHVNLGWRNTAQLHQLMARVSDPRSSSYQQFLTPAQFEARFSPKASEAAAVTSWLKSQGLKVLDVPRDRLYVRASGTVAQIQKAFGTTMHLYKTTQGTRYGTATAPSVPTSLRGVAQGITGLNEVVAVPHHVSEAGTTSAVAGPAALPPPPALFKNAPPCSKFWAQKVDTTDPPAYGVQQPYAPCGQLPGTMRKVYTGAPNSLLGTGQTIAIIDAFASPTIQADANTWSQRRHLANPVITQQVFPPVGAIDSGWWSEESLDVEAVHGMAPNASIFYIGGENASSTGLEEAQNYAVQNAVAPVVSNSYGYLGEVSSSIRNIEDAIFSEGVATGVAFYFSSGDDGDDSVVLGQATPNWPASSANVTAVGGTTLATTSSGNYQFETYWGTDKSTLTGGVWTPAPPGDWLYGAGGGTSHVINEPAYQVGVVPTQFSGRWGGSHRVVPDISLDGDPNTGFEIGLTQEFPDGTDKYSEYRIGGTSLSAPLMAGLMALVNEKAGSPLGFINPALYQLYTDNPAAFRDVVSPATKVAVVRVDYVNGYNNDDGTTTSLRSENDLLTLSSIVGWDDSTGPGSPNGKTFLQGLLNP